MDQAADYDGRIRQQISQYEFVENMHDLPPIFHYYSNKVMRPRLNEVMEADTMAEFFGRHLMSGFHANAEKGESSRPEFVSLGCGDAWLEIEIARYLQSTEAGDFLITALELSPLLAERARAAISEAGLSSHVVVVETDINNWSPSAKVDGVMAHHSLHHFLNLEGIFLATRRALKTNSKFVVADMIGRNGHMRWPETLEIIETIWRNLSPEKRRNHQFRTIADTFDNWDCSVEGFEGIRAQDIMPILLNTFAFHRVLANGGLTDIFVDRAYGWNFNEEDDGDRLFIDLLIEMENRLIDLGHIKPTQLLAVLGLESEGPIRCFDGLTPDRIVRWVR